MQPLALPDVCPAVRRCAAWSDVVGTRSLVGLYSNLLYPNLRGRERGLLALSRRAMRTTGHCRTATVGSAGGARVVWGIQDQIIRLGLLRSHTVSQALAVPIGSMVGLRRVYRLEQIVQLNDAHRP